MAKKVKRSNFKPHHYYNETYQANVYYCLGWPHERFVKYLKSTFDYDLGAIESDGWCAFLAYNDGHITIIWTKRKDDSVCLAHESLHASSFILNRVGVHASFDNDEAQAYLMTEIMRKAR